MELRGRKIIALGERDGVPGPAEFNGGKLPALRLELRKSGIT